MKSSDSKDETVQEKLQSRNIREMLPGQVWLLAIVLLLERFTFFGITAPLQNYMQNDLKIGQTKASAINNAFSVFYQSTPLLAGVIADRWFGRHRTIWTTFLFYSVGCLVLTLTSLSQTHDVRLGGLACGLFMISIGVGGAKACLALLMVDQCQSKMVDSSADGDLETSSKTTEDRAVMLNYVFTISFWVANIGSIAVIITPVLEQKHGFWLAFLLPSCALWVALLLFVAGSSKFFLLPPQGTVLPTMCRDIFLLIRHKFDVATVKILRQDRDLEVNTEGEQTSLEDLLSTIKGCRVIIAFPIMWLCFNQVSNNLVSQAGQMESHGLPNDAMPMLNALACILFAPIIHRCLSVSVKWGLETGPILRITIGFLFTAASMFYTAALQHFIYNAGPCFERPLACPSSLNGMVPNHINVWLQTPLYALMAVGEVLCVVTISEYLYKITPEGMKSIVQALSSVGASVGMGLGVAISPLASDPYLVYMFTTLGIGMVLTAGLFWVLIRSKGMM